MKSAFLVRHEMRPTHARIPPHGQTPPLGNACTSRKNAEMATGPSGIRAVFWSRVVRKPREDSSNDVGL